MPLDTYQLSENHDGLDEARFTICHRFTGIIGEQSMPEISDHHDARRTVRSRDMTEPPHWWWQGLSATGSRARPLASVPDHDTATGGPSVASSTAIGYIMFRVGPPAADTPPPAVVPQFLAPAIASES